MKRSIPIIVSVLIVFGGIGALIAFAPRAQETDAQAAIPQDQIPEGADPAELDENIIARNACVQHGGISMHIHPTLKIIVNGEEQVIPTDIGISDDCMRALHTHDETGRIHIEFPTVFEFTLADFFANWGETFNESQILEHVFDEEHDVVMTVDGVVNEEYENLVLKDFQEIVIEYLEISPK